MARCSAMISAECSVCTSGLRACEEAIATLSVERLPTFPNPRAARASKQESNTPLLPPFEDCDVYGPSCFASDVCLGLERHCGRLRLRRPLLARRNSRDVVRNLASN